MTDFWTSLSPTNDWNGLMLLFALSILIIVCPLYLKTKSRTLLNSLPGIFTSLGILFTFAAICMSLSEIEEKGFNIVNVIQDLIPAFSTSIYGLIGALLSTLLVKINYAIEDYQIVSRLRHRDAEEAIDDIDRNVVDTKEIICKLKNATIETNEKLTSSIEKQGVILTKFVDGFISEMQECFKAMNSAIETRVTAYGEEQYKLSREILEGMTARLSEQAVNMLEEHNKTIQGFTLSNSTRLGEMAGALQDAVEVIKNSTIDEFHRYSEESMAEYKSAAEEQKMFNRELLTSMSESLNSSCKALKDQFTENIGGLKDAVETLRNGTITTLKEFTSESVMIQKENAAEQNKFNSELLEKMSSSLSETVGNISVILRDRCQALADAIKDNVTQLEEAYEFIDNKSATIVSNYEQSCEAYGTAVQNAHDLNHSVGEAISRMNDGMKDISRTNEIVNKAFKLMAESENEIRAIIMRIEELGEAITTLQRLEIVLSKITTK